MKTTDWPFFCCLSCRGELKFSVFTEGKLADTVAEGVLACPSCRTVYPITEGIPLLVHLGYCPDFDPGRFADKWSYKFGFDQGRFFFGSTSESKMNQLAFFNSHSEEYDDDVSDSPFWRAVDSNILGRWIDEIPRSGPVVDLGCGTGRCTIPLAQNGRHVIGTDLSLDMLRRAVTKAEAGGVGDITFFLADAENLPLRPSLFSAVLSYGMLHHVEEPSAILRAARHVLKEEGVFYALENHASPLRFMFNFLMKLNKIWDEEAGSHPLFGIGELEELAESSGLKAEVETSVFLPPHLLNWVGYSSARKALLVTDRLLGRLPGIRSLGGQVVLRARKAPGAMTETSSR